MAKYDRENELLKEFEQTVREIMDTHDAGCDDSLEDDIEYVVSDDLSDSLNEEQFGSDSNSSTVEEILFITPGPTYGSRLDMASGNRLDDSEDFPAGNCDSEASVMASQLSHLNITGPADYRDTGDIVNPGRRKKRAKRRCRNLDD